MSWFSHGEWLDVSKKERRTFFRLMKSHVLIHTKGISPLQRSRRGDGTAKVEEYGFWNVRGAPGARRHFQTRWVHTSSTSAIVPPRRLHCRDNRLVISQVWQEEEGE